MAEGHCFISYSAADGLDFATELADELQGRHPFIKVWFDKRKMDASIVDWDDQLADAIKGCKCLIFVMTADSTAKGSTCKEEWTWALKYKKPVICLLKDKKAEVPFRLNNRQYINVSNDFDSGIAQLRTAIGRLDEPEGLLDELNRRLSEAKRDLQRSQNEDKPRIQLDIEELTKQIEAQEKIVDNPKAAEAQTQKNIEAGLERERKPERPTVAQTSTKFINPPPGIAPNYFQDRVVETKQIVDFLNNDFQRLMTIVGRGGVGKTAMVCRLLKGLEAGELPDGLGVMKVDGIVYLSESGSHRVNFANIFYDLCKLLPSETANELDAVYKNPQGSTESKMRAVLEKFTSGRVVLLLDNFEPLVDTETFAIRDAELDEALRAFLNGAHTAVNIITTTRVAPRALNLIQPGRQRVLTLDEGLESPYAENILREMDSDGRVGLKSAPADLLNRARERTRGYPRALEALFAILASDRYTTLEELLAMPTPENVVEALVGEAFNRLDMNAQKVMQALAVYNRPVTPAAVDYLLAPHLPAIDSSPILQRLANMHFARKESGRFYLHPVDREFAFSLIPVEDLTTTPKERRQADTMGAKDFEFDSLFESSRASQFDAFIQHDLTSRAADYFAQARKPRAEWKKLDDLAAQLAEFDLRCVAGDYNTAARVLEGIDFDCLLLWGHYRFTLDLYNKIYKNITDKPLRQSIIGNMGTTYYYMSQYSIALLFHTEALDLVRQVGNKSGEAVWLNWIANSHFSLGKVHDAIAQYELSLKLAKEFGKLEDEGYALDNLGASYATLGNLNKAIEVIEQSLAIAREISNPRGEGHALDQLGSLYASLGNVNKAIEFHVQALMIAHKIGDRQGESSYTENTGHAWLSIGKYQKAIENYEQSIQIADEISLPHSQQNARCGLAQIYLFHNDLVNARTTIEAALQYDVQQDDYGASALHGIIALRQGEKETAQEAFMKSIAQADEILAKTPEYYSALDAKGLALCGLALTTGGSHLRDDCLLQAIDTLRSARKIAPHAGIVKRALRLFDELVKCDEEGILKDVRSAVEGKE